MSSILRLVRASAAAVPAGPVPNPLDALPAVINHLLAAEPWARAQLVPHVNKTLHVVVSRSRSSSRSRRTARSRARPPAAPADTTVTLPYSAVPRLVAGGGDAVMRDLRLDGDAEFAQAVSLLAANLRWDVEEDLSKVVGDAASHRLVSAARARDRPRSGATNERVVAGMSEYLLEENPQLVRPRAVQTLADGVRQLRDDLARLEKRVDRLTSGAAALAHRRRCVGVAPRRGRQIAAPGLSDADLPALHHRARAVALRARRDRGRRHLDPVAVALDPRECASAATSRRRAR